MKTNLCLAIALGLLAAVGSAAAQTIAALQLAQSPVVTYNYQATNGAPTTNVNASAGSLSVSTTNNFAALVSFGAVAQPLNTKAILTNNLTAYTAGGTAFSPPGSAAYSGSVAAAIGLPTGVTANGLLVLQQAQVGAPYVSLPPSLFFGSVIAPPLSDDTGIGTGGGSAYWRSKPLDTVLLGSTNNPFYYSVNAQQVFATQSGQINVTWIGAAEYPNAAAVAYTNSAGQFLSPPVPSLITNSDNTVSVLYTVSYIVSPTPVKSPQTIYWTEGSFEALSHPIVVPPGRITAFNVVFNSSVPASVPVQYPDPSLVGTNYTRTLWYDSSQSIIHAFNAQGRVFVELLGQATANGGNEFLGFEIVDIVKSASPVDVTNNLGEVLSPYTDPTLGSDLAASPINNLGSQFYYKNGNTYYADQATVNLTDLQMYWLDTGVAGLQWPFVLDRYHLVWPADSSQYSFYLRPDATNPTAAALTAVQLDPFETPAIDYQDPLDQTRAFLTSADAFYTWLTPAYPAQRALLRFNYDGNVRFERVFSYLSAAVQTNAVLLNSVATNLSSFASYLNYPTSSNQYSAYLVASNAWQNYFNYETYVTALPRGVNGAWQLYVTNNASLGGGSLSQWSLLVDTTNAAGTVLTYAFTNATALVINPTNAATPYPAPVMVSGITNAVTGIRVQLTGLGSPLPAGVAAYLVGPQSSVCALVSAAGGLLSPGWKGLTSSLSGLPQSQNWNSVAMSADGSHLLASLLNSGYCYASTNAGFTWTATTTLPQNHWPGLASSADGTRLLAASGNGQLWTSTNGGLLWTDQTNVPGSGSFSSAAASADGTHLLAGVSNGGYLWSSTNGGLSWQTNTTPYNKYLAVASSTNGSVLVAAVANLGIYTSTNGGINWSLTASNAIPAIYNSYALASAASGGTLFSAPGVNKGNIYVSTNSGLTWAALTNSPNDIYSGLVTSANGNQLFALSQNNTVVYASANDGLTWTTNALTRPGNPQNVTPLACSADGSKAIVAGQPSIYSLGTNAAIYGVNLVFSDAATASVPQFSLITSGTYLPSDYAATDVLPWNVSGGNTASLNALLLPAPAFVAAPPQPWDTNAPAVVANPGPTLPALPWPALVTGTVNVGDRITAPAGEIGSTNGTAYLAGYVNTNVDASLLGNPNLGTAYSPEAYVDPFANGFAKANLGAIIPVNAIPGQNQLEVWWFRPNSVNQNQGFQTVYWPEVIGDYTVQWPANPAHKIVLASNAGSGPLDSLHAAGHIYQGHNDPTQPGYNPNEEHGIMFAGQAYALRDDLNITNGPNYSSAPFVLLAYTDSDGRPSITPYQVQREDPAAGVYFDYVVTAGSVLQAPMPLPLMAPPLKPGVFVTNMVTVATALGTNTVTNIVYSVSSYNTEPAATSGDVPAGWSAAETNGPNALYQSFTFRDRNQEFWVYRGLNAGLPPLQAGMYDPATASIDLPLPPATAVVGQPFQSFIHVSRQLASLTVGLTNGPAWLGYSANPTNGLSLTGTPDAAGSYPAVQIIITDTADNIRVTNTLALTITAGTGSVTALGPLVITCTNAYAGESETFSNRPPALARDVAPTNSFTMQFYYQNQAGFDWPGVAQPPAVGAVVPYLRAQTNGVFAGDPTVPTTSSLDIVYRPVWPELGPNGQPLPVLNVGQTLTTAVNGLPAVRGQDSVQVLYQQSIATNYTPAQYSFSPSLGLQATFPAQANPSVVLFDPTTQKHSAALTHGLPTSIRTDPYNGLFFFPNLPPNLISRLWFDPNGNQLVLEGQFVSDPVNGDYVMLNVLRGNDLAAVNALCSPNDTVNYPLWTNAVAQLANVEYTKYQDVYGNYVINPTLTVTNGVGSVVEVTSSDTPVDSYALSAAGPGQGYVSFVVANGSNPSYAGDPVTVYLARVGQPLFPGALVLANNANASPFSQLVTFQHTADLAGRTGQYVYDWRIEPPVNGQPPALGSEPSWTQLSPPTPGIPLGPVYTLGAEGIQGLVDNYVSLRYGYTNAQKQVVWSPWANPLLVPGWISRVTQAIDPVAGQTQDLYDNPATTTASLIQLAGARWNGDVPLNAASLTNNGLIQIYETVLDVGKNLSINAGINYGPANQALLLAAGYLNDFYLTLGNAAWADSLNPTIGFGTDNQTYGSVATASFTFEGQEPTLLEQNLALLRGRDDSLSPGVDLPPAYNRLYWNYTYGLDAGQVIYALNYNITDQNGDGKVNAADAQIMFPQGHGDAYGHYLTGLMDYYELLMNPNFDWVPQASTVLVLGAAVTVNYQNETKFATTAAALARTGRQVFDLTWRQDYRPGTAGGWSYCASNYVGQYTYVDNQGNTDPITRYWGLFHWGSRVGQGTYLNWVVANSLLPYQDTNPQDQGVQIVDRQTVQELAELPATAQELQADMDNAVAGFTPLGLAQNAIPFDINPQQVTGANPQTHFEQVYARAVQALNNAVTAFNAAQSVTTELRQQQNSLSDLQATVAQQELAYNDQLIELYGTPYGDDFGPGATYAYGYTGPDLLHYMYVDNVQGSNTYNGILQNPTIAQTYTVDIQNPANWFNRSFTAFNIVQGSSNNAVTFNVSADTLLKPATWTSERGTVGSIQTAIASMNAANDAYRNACYQSTYDKANLDQAIQLFTAQNAINQASLGFQAQIAATNTYANTKTAEVNNSLNAFNNAINFDNELLNTLQVSLPSTTILGVAAGGDFQKVVEALISAPALAVVGGIYAGEDIAYADLNNKVSAAQNSVLNYGQEIATNQYTLNLQNSIQSLANQEAGIQKDLASINQAAIALNGAQANYQSLLAQGNRIQLERETFRQHTAAQVQGDTVADAAFLVFQNEDLQRYTTLFNLAAEYAYMAANAYDYETGLLNTDAGRAFLNQIISSSALGIIQNGQPQISGTDTGDPGLANALAEMDADWQVLKGRLGFNNPDGYGTTVSLRTENYRILPGAAGDSQWQELLEQNVMPDLLADSDVRQNCLQIDNGTGAAVPGIELTFSTTVTDGQNLFGQPLGPGDHSFTSSTFATKIFAAGVCFDGYVGMDNPISNSGAAGTTPADPTLDPNGLAATPYCYLIPCGADSMRSPPLGDPSTVRTWNVDDVAIPLPFNIGASDFSTKPFYTSANSLTEPLFAVRKMQSFRPVSTLAAFNTSIYGATGSLQPSQYTNQRLIGRSIWNSKWKLIIPGKTLLADPNQGLARFINSVKDVHLYFVTYSYSGN